MEEHSRRPVADVLPGVRRPAGDEDIRAGRPGVDLVAELESHLAVEHEDCVVLIRVRMQRRSLAGRNEVLECCQGAVGLLAARLEYQFYAQRVALALPSPGRWNTGSAMPPPLDRCHELSQPHSRPLARMREALDEPNAAGWRLASLHRVNSSLQPTLVGAAGLKGSPVRACRDRPIRRLVRATTWARH